MFSGCIFTSRKSINSSDENLAVSEFNINPPATMKINIATTIPMMKLSLSERVFYTSEPHTIYYKEMETHLPVLESLQEMLLSIKPFEMNIEEAFQLGLLYKTFYTIYSNKTIHTSLYYALGYQGYMNVLNELYKNVELKLLSNATFYKNIALI